MERNIEDMAQKALNDMEYVPEKEPVDYMCVVSLGNLQVAKTIKAMTKDMPENIDADVREVADTVTKGMSMINLKVNASSIQEATTRVYETISKLFFIDGMTNGFDILHNLIVEHDKGELPEQMMEGIDATGIQATNNIYANSIFTNMGLFQDIADSTSKGAEIMSNMDFPVIKSILVFEEGHIEGLFGDMPEKLQQMINETIDEEGGETNNEDS